MSHIILISGFARSGKDTLAKALSFELQKREQCDTPVFKFADPLRRALKQALVSIGLDYIDPWTEDPETKALLRPLMVEFGKYARSINKDVFVNATLKDIEDARENSYVPLFPIIADLRYLNEIQRFRSWASNQRRETTIVRAHIGRQGIEAANDEEARSFADLDCNDMPDARWTFGAGDFDGIQRWAADIAEKVVAHKALISKPVVTASVPEHLTGTIKVPDNELLEQVLGIRLALERMDARIKRLEVGRG